jgi:hypothetical protein
MTFWELAESGSSALPSRVAGENLRRCAYHGQMVEYFNEVAAYSRLWAGTDALSNGKDDLDGLRFARFASNGGESHPAIASLLLRSIKTITVQG